MLPLLFVYGRAYEPELSAMNNPVSVCKLVLLGLIAIAGAAACQKSIDGTLPPAPDAGVEAPGDGGVGPSAHPAESCGLVGRYRVTSVPSGPACDEWPRIDEEIAIAIDGDAAFIRAGLLELAIPREQDGCTLRAAGCSKSETRYLAPQLRISKTPSGIRVEASAKDVLNGFVGPCSEGVFEASPIAGCNPVGSFAADEGSLASGSCDLSWPAADVSVFAQGGDDYNIEWGTTSIGATLDAETCTLTGSKGRGGSTWLYNGAARELDLVLHLVDDALEGSATEKLEGTTSDHKSCAGGVYTLRAHRPAARATARFAPTCTEPSPPACGDDVCEAGEGCRCADCACGDGMVCVDDNVCRSPCTLDTEADACGAGKRCTAFFGANCAAVRPGIDQLYCDAAGARGRGESCTCSSECAAGLVCHVPAGAQAGAQCSPPCGDGFAECAAGETCSLQGDGSGAGWIAGAQMACERLVGIGEDCSQNSCEGSLFCIKYCPAAGCRFLCTQSCTSSSNCPAVLPVCATSARFCAPAQ